MAPQTKDLGENVNVSEIRRQIQDVVGVINVSDVLVYNKVGGQYSSSEHHKDILILQQNKLS